MSTKTVRVLGSLFAGIALAATAACAQSEATDPAVQRALDGVLVADDLPAGYEVVELGKDAASVIADQLDDSRKDAEVTPAACRSDAPTPDEADTGRVVAVNGDAVLSESVARWDVDAAALEAAVTGRCAQVRVAITVGAAAGTTVDIVHADVATPTVAGHRGVTFRQTTTAQDSAEKREMLIARIPVDGYLVTVQAARADGGAPDRGAFDAAVTAAVERLIDTR